MPTATPRTGPRGVKWTVASAVDSSTAAYLLRLPRVTTLDVAVVKGPFLANDKIPSKLLYDVQLDEISLFVY